MDAVLPGSDLGFVLGDVFRLWRQAFDKAIDAAELPLTPGEVRALAHVTRSPGLRQNRLAEIMQIEPMTASAYLLRLEELGFVRRNVDPRDRRARLVMPGPMAQDLLGKLAPLVAAVNEAAVQGIEPGLRQHLAALLATMRANLCGSAA